MWAHDCTKCYVDSEHNDYDPNLPRCKIGSPAIKDKENHSSNKAAPAKSPRMEHHLPTHLVGDENKNTDYEYETVRSDVSAPDDVSSWNTLVATNTYIYISVK